MWVRIFRIMAAIIIAPWATLLAVGLHVVVAGLIAGHETWEMSLNYGPFALYGLLIAYPATIVLGVPAHLLLSYFNVGHIWVHSAIGGGVALFVAAFVFNLFTIESWQVSITYSTLFVLSGAVVAGVFGAVAGKPSLARLV